MKHLSSLVLVLLVVLISCMPPKNPSPGSPTCATNTQFVTLYLDPTFTSAEQDAVIGASQDWREFSHERVVIGVMLNPAPLLANLIVRVKSTDDIVVKQDELQAKARGLSEFITAGWSESGPPRRIYLVVDRVTTPQLRPLAGHEFGHAAGLFWPGCVEDARQLCKHSPDPNALMAGAPKLSPLGAGDQAFCQASCLCD